MLSVVVFSFLLKDLQKTSITAALPSLSCIKYMVFMEPLLTRDDRGTWDATGSGWGFLWPLAEWGIFFVPSTMTHAKQVPSLGHSLSFGVVNTKLLLLSFLTGYWYNPVKCRHLYLWCMIQFWQTTTIAYVVRGYFLLLLISFRLET